MHHYVVESEDLDAISYLTMEAFRFSNTDWMQLGFIRPNPITVALMSPSRLVHLPVSHVVYAFESGSSFPDIGCTDGIHFLRLTEAQAKIITEINRPDMRTRISKAFLNCG